MKSVTASITLQSPQGSTMPCLLRTAITLLLTAALAACSTTTSPFTHYVQISSLPPLQLDDRVITIAEASERIVTPDLLVVDDEMREFLARYTDNIKHKRQRLVTLHDAISGSATLGIDYDPLASGTAQDVFHRGSANCLSYAALFVAMAREVGLDAQFQWLEVRPQWTRKGERVMLRLHVNVAVKMRGKQQFMVDIDPLQSRDIASSRLISDTDAQALHHSNIAMEYLAVEDLEFAWLHGLRAVQLSPGISHLWVNLGAIYRAAGQHRAAEANYQYALKLDPWERSAMNNLGVLYEIEGNIDEKEYWERRVAQYRNSNPYYHAWLGDQAGEGEDWRKAVQYYEKALALMPQDSGLLYALGLLHARLGEYEVASSYLQQAIASATLYSDIKVYEAELLVLQSKRQAGS
ncbi:MAG: Flp pilus assembly protein TadD [Halioglobus sp.]|jgi:Flp pilus assembly protein TadD